MTNSFISAFVDFSIKDMLKYKNIDRASEMRLFAARRSPTKQKHDLNQEVGGLRGDP